MIKLCRRFEASFADHLWKTASLWHRSAYNMKDQQRKKHLASLTDRLVLGQMGRRDFLRSAGRPRVGSREQALRVVPPCPCATAALGGHHGLAEGCREAVRGHTTLKLATESTPPSKALNSQLKRHFERATGIKVEIELLPVEQVLQKLTLDIASSLGTHDLYYIDQSWAASFGPDVLDPRLPTFPGRRHSQI